MKTTINADTILHANRLLTSHQIKAVEQQIFAQSDSEYSVMVEAATAATKVLRMNMPMIRQIGIVVGAGNNGGDGYVMAALLQEMGLDVCVWAAAVPATDSAQQARMAAEQANVAIIDAQSNEEFCQSLADGQVEIWVDALLGTGVKGEVKDPLQAVIKQLNQSSIPVISIDMPSGLNSDTGQVLGEAIAAKMTITVIAHKLGQFTCDGPDYCGEVVLATLDIDEDLIQQGLAAAKETADSPVEKAPIERVSWLQCRRQYPLHLPKRAGNSHKGNFGHSLIIGGDTGMSGAAILASEAALRCGSGKVSCATQDVTVGALLARVPEVMAHGVRTGLQLQPLLQQATVLAAGPGLGSSSWGQLLLQQVLHASHPLVLDADALNLLAADNGFVPEFAQRSVVMTPHPGEAAKLLSSVGQPRQVADIQANRVASAIELATTFKAVIILKGQGTVIAHPDGRTAICSDGNPGMSSAGMGDVLTGVIVALLAQGLDDWHSAVLASCIHAHAGDQAQQPGGQRGMLASDLFPWLRQLSNI